MARPSVAEGFQLWRDEVRELERPEKFIPYIPILALVGVYVTFTDGSAKHTSYDWRQAVLANDDAREGLRRSVEDNFKRYIDDDSFILPLSFLKPSPDAALHYKRTYESVKDGLPLPVVGLPINEEFLANHLGLACHDDELRMQPLRLLPQGQYVVDTQYPKTAQLLKEHV